MLTKEDYMRLPKERLAELLVEATAALEFQKAVKDVKIEPYPYAPTSPTINPGITPWITYCDANTADSMDSKHGVRIETN